MRFLIALLATAGFGQAQFINEQIPDDYLLDQGPQGIHGSAVHGDFNGNGTLDVAYITGSIVEVRFDPGLFDIRMLNVASARDLIACPNPLGHHDILAAGPAGLERHSWDGTAWQSNVVSSSWSDVDELRSRLTNGVLYVLGLEDDDATLHAAQVSGNNYLMSTMDLALPDDIDDYELLQWNGSGPPEIAVAFSDKLHIRTWNSGQALIASHTAAGYGQSVFQRLSKDDSPFEWLAWLATQGAGATQTLGVVGPTGFVYIEVLGSGLDVYAMVAADYDGDGRDDLLFNARDSHDPGILLNVGTGSAPPSFNINGPLPPSNSGHPVGVRERLETGLSGAATSAQAVLVACDLDNDGDVDIALGLDQADAMWIAKEARVVEHDLCSPSVNLTAGDGDYGAFGARIDACEMELGPDDLWTGTTNVSLTIAEPNVILPGADHLQFLVWVIDPVAGAVDPIPLDTGAPRLLTGVPGSTHVVDVDVTTETLATNGIGMEEVLAVCIRTVDYDPVTGEFLAKYPGELFGIEALMSSETDNPNADLIKAAFPEGLFDVQGVQDGWCDGEEGNLPGGDDNGTGGGGDTIPCSNDSPPRGT